MSGFSTPFMATDPDVYEHFMGRWSERLAPPFLEFAKIELPARVLDVGCGTGTLALALAQRGATVVGMDASEGYLLGARRRRSHPNINYEHGDASDLQYPTASFDACISTLAIDVVPDADLVAKEMRRVTVPGGVVACGTFDFWGAIPGLISCLIRPLCCTRVCGPCGINSNRAHSSGHMVRQTSGAESV